MYVELSGRYHIYNNNSHIETGSTATHIFIRAISSITGSLQPIMCTWSKWQLQPIIALSERTILILGITNNHIPQRSRLSSKVSIFILVRGLIFLEYSMNTDTNHESEERHVHVTDVCHLSPAIFIINCTVLYTI